MAALPKVRGHVDAVGRPVVSILSTQTGDPFLATVDTGFNGWLMTSKLDAPTIGVRFDDGVQGVELGDGRKVFVQTGRLVIEWLGALLDAEVFVSDDPSTGSEGRPVALIGAELLSPHLLLVDYGAKTVDIETQE